MLQLLQLLATISQDPEEVGGAVAKEDATSSIGVLLRSLAW